MLGARHAQKHLALSSLQVDRGEKELRQRPGESTHQISSQAKQDQFRAMK